MCQTRNSRRITIGKRTFRVDGCMAEHIVHLNSIGIETLGCCCGHGRYFRTVVIREKNGIVRELHSGVIIPRKRRFYRTDADGYYYIPELAKHGDGAGACVRKERVQ